MGRCEQVWYVTKPEFFDTPLEEMPQDDRELFVKERCDQEATVTAHRTGSRYPGLNGPIEVCEGHHKDVLMMNKLNEMFGG